jgi:hypothetical protein
MATTYEWSFPNFETNSENVVKTIHWRYTATDAETDTFGNPVYTASMYGSCAGSDGMDFDAMTKDHAIACVVENNSSEEEMQSNLSAQIEEQKNPATVSKTKEF